MPSLTTNPNDSIPSASIDENKQEDNPKWKYEGIPQVKYIEDQLRETYGTCDAIRYRLAKGDHYFEAVEFYQNDQLVKEINLESINPFNQLDFPVVDTSYGAKTYDLRGVPKEKLEEVLGPLPGENLSIKGAFGQVMVDNEPIMRCVSTVVSFNLWLSGDDGQIPIVLAEYWVVDSIGQIVNKIRTWNGGSEAKITRDGKYIAVSYGGPQGEPGPSDPKTGVAIYDVSSGEKVIDFPAVMTYSMGATIEEIILLLSTGSGSEYIVIDPEIKKAYRAFIPPNFPESMPYYKKGGAEFTWNGVRKFWKYAEDFEPVKIEE